MKKQSLPLGIDIGATRLRIAHAHDWGEGPRIRAVAVRELAAESFTSGESAASDYVRTLIDDMLIELGTRERRCVAALGEPDAVLRQLPFPRMTGAERERCARFEAARYADFPVEESAVRIHPIAGDGQNWALGIARKPALERRVAALRAAKLKVMAIDHEACALARALPTFDAILDVGHRRASLHALGTAVPRTLQSFGGGSDITRAIERDLAVDERSAEKRKRILGTAGAGERAKATLTSDIAGLIQSARERTDVRSVALVGNGARLPGFACDLEAATGVRCEFPIADALRGEQYPDDVVRSGAPDWTLATGLALWGQR